MDNSAIVEVAVDNGKKLAVAAYNRGFIEGTGYTLAAAGIGYLLLKYMNAPVDAAKI